MGSLRNSLLSASLVFAAPAAAKDNTLPDGTNPAEIYTHADFLSYQTMMQSAFHAGDFIEAYSLYKVLEKSEEKLDIDISAHTHFQGAQAALEIGKVDEFHRRLIRAQEKDPTNEEYKKAREAFEAEYFYQVLPKGTLAANFELNARAKQVLQDANTVLKYASSGFRGYLPRGEYEFNGEVLTFPSEEAVVADVGGFSDEVKNAISTALVEAEVEMEMEAFGPAPTLGALLEQVDVKSAEGDVEGVLRLMNLARPYSKPADKWMVDMITNAMIDNHGWIVHPAPGDEVITGMVDYLQCKAFAHGTQDWLVVERANEIIERTGAYEGLVPECLYTANGIIYDVRSKQPPLVIR